MTDESIIKMTEVTDEVERGEETEDSGCGA